MTFLKKVIKKILHGLGYDIRRLPTHSKAKKQPIAMAQGIPVYSAIEHNTRQRTNEYYSNEEAVRQYLSPDRLQFYKEVISLVREKVSELTARKAQQSVQIGDVGCGPGDLLAYLTDSLEPAGAGYAMTGLDFSEAAIRVASQRFPHISFHVFDIYQDFEQYTSSFDLLFCTEVLEHLLYPAKALSHLLSMTKEMLVLTVPDGRKDTFAGHINFWSPESWEVFVREGTLKEYPAAKIQIGYLEKNNINYAIIELNDNER
ncbi:class I SAM-dependent methyltransferase [Thermonema rossianum]|uniref:class I SAM-dependent methyltransferase n=1 Tax=Thermonema rossianum TaxID=55505 RepID=UPI00056F419E|nr:class I SAM-dependent methyltransferase [Thermonema rossianum]